MVDRDTGDLSAAVAEAAGGRAIDAFLVGEKTETWRRANPDGSQRYRPGRTYAVQPGRTEKGVVRIRVLSAEREALEEVTEEGANREGFEDLAAFFDYWRGLYGKVRLSQDVWVIRFELVRRGER